MHVYILADFFNVCGLKALCAYKFSKHASSLWRSDTLIDAVAEVYSMPLAPEDLMRKAIVKITLEHIEELQLGIGFERLLRRYAEFSADLVKALVSRSAVCSRCTGWG